MTQNLVPNSPIEVVSKEDASDTRRRRQLSLRTTMIWIVPYFAIGCVILTAFREPMITPGEGVPLFHWLRLIVLAGFTLAWVLMYRESAHLKELKRTSRSYFDDRGVEKK